MGTSGGIKDSKSRFWNWAVPGNRLPEQEDKNTGQMDGSFHLHQLFCLRFARCQPKQETVATPNKASVEGSGTGVGEKEIESKTNVGGKAPLKPVNAKVLSWPANLEISVPKTE